MDLEGGFRFDPTEREGTGRDQAFQPIGNNQAGGTHRVKSVEINAN